MTPPLLAIIVPCYNEAAVINETARRLRAVLDDLISKTRISPESFIYFVDDGSKDGSWETLAELHRAAPVFKGLKLSANSGHQNALLAGLLSVRDKIDCAVTIDADLQDDVAVMETMIAHFTAGRDIVYGVRREREEDTYFKRCSALMFYKLMQWMGVDIVFNHADYRLVSRKVLLHLSDFREVNLFLRGLFPLIGLPSEKVYYNRIKRLGGESKYSLGRMAGFALDGITSFSTAPLRIITLSGLLISVFSLLMSAWVLAGFFMGKTVPGWASTVLPMYLIGGFQLFGLGLIGEYIGKIYKEVKARPRFIRETELF